MRAFLRHSLNTVFGPLDEAEAGFDPEHLRSAIGNFRENIQTHRKNFVRLPDPDSAHDLLTHHYFDDQGNFRNETPYRPKSAHLIDRLMARNPGKYGSKRAAANAVTHLNKAFHKSLEGNQNLEPHRSTVIPLNLRAARANVTPESVKKRQDTYVSKRNAKLASQVKTWPSTTSTSDSSVINPVITTMAAGLPVGVRPKSGQPN